MFLLKSFKESKVEIVEVLAKALLRISKCEKLLKIGQIIKVVKTHNIKSMKKAIQCLFINSC